MREGDVLVGNALITIRSGGHWLRLAVIIHLHRRALLLSFVGDRWWCASPVVAGGGCGWF